MSPIDDEKFTVKEIVIEIRDTLKDLATKVDRIDRQGSIGTKAELEDHENRLRKIEDALAERQEQIRQFRAVQQEIESMKAFRWKGLGVVSTIAFVMPVLATISWHLWG